MSGRGVTDEIGERRPSGVRAVLRAPRFTLARSAVVGIAATLVDLAALWLLVQGAGLHPALANVPALALGLAVQFFGNKRFAFRDRSRDLVRQGTRFAAVEAGAFALNALAYHLLVTFTALPYPLARLAGSAAVYFGFSFPLWGRIFGPAAVGTAAAGAAAEGPAPEGSA